MSTLMPYVLLVSCVVVAAALLAERALGALGRPTRGVWLAALAASIAMPILTSAVDGAQGGPSAAGVFAGPGGDTLGEVAAATLEKPVPSAVEPGFVWQEWTEWARWSGWQSLVDAASWSSSEALDDALLALWAAASTLVLLAHGAAWVALRRMLRRLRGARTAERGEYRVRPRTLERVPMAWRPWWLQDGRAPGSRIGNPLQMSRSRG